MHFNGSQCCIFRFRQCSAGGTVLFWQQSHVVISLCSGEALHFEQGVSPSFLPFMTPRGIELTRRKHYWMLTQIAGVNYTLLSKLSNYKLGYFLIKCSKCWSLQRLASIVQFLSDFQIPLLSLTCEKRKEKENHWYILGFEDFCPILCTKIFSFLILSNEFSYSIQTLNHISTGNFKNSSTAKYPASLLVLHNPTLVRSTPYWKIMVKLIGHWIQD